MLTSILLARFTDEGQEDQENKAARNGLYEKEGIERRRNALPVLRQKVIEGLVREGKRDGLKSRGLGKKRSRWGGGGQKAI